MYSYVRNGVLFNPFFLSRVRQHQQNRAPHGNILILLSSEVPRPPCLLSPTPKGTAGPCLLRHGVALEGDFTPSLGPPPPFPPRWAVLPPIADLAGFPPTNGWCPAPLPLLSRRESCAGARHGTTTGPPGPAAPSLVAHLLSSTEEPLLATTYHIPARLYTIHIQHVQYTRYMCPPVHHTRARFLTCPGVSPSMCVWRASIKPHHQWCGRHIRLLLFLLLCCSSHQTHLYTAKIARGDKRRILFLCMYLLWKKYPLWVNQSTGRSALPDTLPRAREGGRVPVSERQSDLSCARGWPPRRTWPRPAGRPSPVNSRTKARVPPAPTVGLSISDLHLGANKSVWNGWPVCVADAEICRISLQTF